jgi:predicted dehydrogenase
MVHVSRRGFLKRSLAFTGAAFAFGGPLAARKVLGANETVRIGVAGLNGRGGSHVGAYLSMDGVEIAYLIDPDTRTFKGHLESIGKRGKPAPKTVQDVRRALEDKDLDALSIATTNHWHAPMTIWACQAGKDVYVEKPMSHNIHEGRIAVETARAQKCIVQHGTQGRSEKKWAQLAEIVRQGTYGKLLVSYGLCYKRRTSIGFKEPSPPPPEVDFNIWLGPAPDQPHHANLVHYNWHWFWDFGNGDIGNQGVHQIDVARWMIPGAAWPKRVISLGGRFGYQDQGQTPNTQIAVMDYGETQLIFEVRGLETDAFNGEAVGNVLVFEKGIVAGGKFTPNGGKPEALPTVSASRGPGGDIFRNFIIAVRSRKQADLDADVLEAHYSAGLCHLANISYRLGEEVPFNPKTKAFGEDKFAYESLARMEEHLGRNGIKLMEAKYRLGRALGFDAAAEKFVNAPDADALLTRNYRKPFVIPERV